MEYNRKMWPRENIALDGAECYCIVTGSLRPHLSTIFFTMLEYTVYFYWFNVHNESRATIKKGAS